MKNQLNFKIIIAIVIMGLSACKKDEEQPQPIGQKPIVDAGADTEIFFPVNIIQLIGSAEDLDGTVVSTTWKQKSVPNQAVLTDAQSKQATASILIEGEYVFEFQAIDNKGNLSKDEVKVKVSPYLDANLSLLLKQISYSANDFISIEYDAMNRIKRYTSQYQNTQGNPNAVSRFVYEMVYDAADLLKEMKVNGIVRYKYYYTNRILTKTEEVKPNGELFETKYYTFENGYLKSEESEFINPLNSLIAKKVLYEYDVHTNLVKKTFFEKYENESDYTLSSTLTYSDFDDERKADNFRMNTPYLPEVRFQLNNPRKMEHKAADGTLLQSERYTYSYRNHGLPSQVIKENLLVPSASLSAFFMY